MMQSATTVIVWLLLTQPINASYEYKLMGIDSTCEPSFPSITELPFKVNLDVRIDTLDDSDSQQQTIFDMGDKEGWGTFFFLGQNLLQESTPTVPLFHTQANGLPQQTFGSNQYEMGNRLAMTGQSYTVGNDDMMRLSFGVEADGTMWLRDRNTNALLGTMVMGSLPTMSNSMVMDFARSLSPTRSLVYGPLKGAVSGIEVSTSQTASTLSMTQRMLYNNYVGQIFDQPFAASFYARFQDLSYDTNQAVFDFGNFDADNVYCRQDSSSDRMLCGVKVGSSHYQVVTPDGSIEEGSWAFWQFQVNETGVYGIFKNGIRLNQENHASVLPSKVFRKDMHIARSNWAASDGRMQGVVAGFRIDRLDLFSKSTVDAVTTSNGCETCTSSYECPSGYAPTTSCPIDINDCVAVCTNGGFTCPNTYIPNNSCPQSSADCTCYRSNCVAGQLVVSVTGVSGGYNGNVIVHLMHRDGTAAETVLIADYRNNVGGTYTLNLAEGDVVRLGIHVSNHGGKVWSNNPSGCKTISHTGTSEITTVNLGFEDDGGTDRENVLVSATISYNAVLMAPTYFVATGVTDELLANEYFYSSSDFNTDWSVLNPTGGGAPYYNSGTGGIHVNHGNEVANGDGIEQTVSTVPYTTLMAFVELRTEGSVSATHSVLVEIIDATSSAVLATALASVSTGVRETVTLSAQATSPTTTIRVTNPSSSTTIASDLVIVHVSLTGFEL